MSHAGASLRLWTDPVNALGPEPPQRAKRKEPPWTGFPQEDGGLGGWRVTARRGPAAGAAVLLAVALLGLGANVPLS
jgi:hypothetical protein